MRKIVGLLVLLFSLPAMADWQVDPEHSHIGFASVKNDLIAEIHSFTEVSGTVGLTGEAMIVISLASVETNIPIRNERMQAMLFEVDSHPDATITSSLPMEEFTAMNTGDSLRRSIGLSIDLHGTKLKKDVVVKVTRSGDETFEVTSLGPILVHASQFALADGVEALRKVAGLQSIDLMVPVTFDLRLVKSGG